MASISRRRILAFSALLLVLALGTGGWLLGSRSAEQAVERWVRRALTRNSGLVLAPFSVRLTPWRDFPHLTASVHRLSLTDTSFRQQVPVLQVQRADLRLAWRDLLRGRVQVSRLAISGALFQERTDSLGRSWGLRGQRPRGTGAPPTLALGLDSVIVRDLRIRTSNGYSHSAFGATVHLARLSARLQEGVLQAGGAVRGQLDYLRSKAGNLFENEPVQARVNYRYAFGQRQGQLWGTRGTLNGDTIAISGTHTVDPAQPRGTMLNLRFEGSQPLVEVLRVALPPTLETHLTGATSPSKAYILYTIQGLSGPMTSPHNVLQFKLNGASLRWPDAARRIKRWDLAGTYDNGPEHAAQSTVLTLSRCRIYTAAGQLDAALTVRNFRRPVVLGHVQGRTELPELAALVAPGLWRGLGGVADIDLRLRGPLPARRTLRPDQQLRRLSVRGTVGLRNASFVLLPRNAAFSGVNVQVGLRDSLWQLTNASGTVDSMRFKATATTVNLLHFLTAQQGSARISGSFAVDELRLGRLRELLRPMPPRLGTQFSPTSLPKPGRRPRPDLATSLGSSLIPPGLKLNVNLRCQRLVLAPDTLSDLAVTVRHEGQRVQLSGLAGRMWGGLVRGELAWPAGAKNHMAPVDFRLGLQFKVVNYERLLARLNAPPLRVAARRPAASGKPRQPSPAVRELLLAANGRLSCDIGTVQLPDGGRLRAVQLQVHKQGNQLAMPSLRFVTPEGGTGEATGSAEVAGLRLVRGDAQVNLRYATLDVQRLLTTIASLTPEPDSLPTALALARSEARAARRTQRAQENNTLLSNGKLTALVRVQADEVRYAAIRGKRFRMLSRLSDGEAALEECTLEAMQGRISLHGRMLTSAGRYHHPLRVQMRLDGLDLPEVFTAATAMGLNVLNGSNVRGTLHCAADLHTDLGSTFLPAFDQTYGYLRTDLRNLELLQVEALEQALKFMRVQRTEHLYFEPVSSIFVLNRGQVLIPNLRLNSNLSNLAVSGTYGLDGSANLFVGVNPFQALFGDNKKRIERIQTGESIDRGKGKLNYVSLRRPGPGQKYKLRVFQKEEQRTHELALRQQLQELLRTQRLDTTLQLLK